MRLILLLLALSVSVLAQQPAPCGESTQGALSRSGQVDLYTFVGAAADRVAIRVTRTGGDGVPLIELRRPDGSRLAQTTFGRLEAELPSAGTYTVAISAATLTASTSYMLYWQNLLAPCNATALVAGGGVAFSNRTPGATMAFTFTAPAGEMVGIKVEFTSSNWSPTVDLYGPTGALVSRNPSWFHYRVTTGGRHLILVRDEYDPFTFGSGNGTRIGNGVANFQRLSSPVNTRELAPGEMAEANEPQPGWNLWFTFEASAGDNVSIFATRSGGEWSPHITLHGPDGSWLENSFIGVMNRTITQTGRYAFVIYHWPDPAINGGSMSASGTGSAAVVFQRWNRPAGAQSLTCARWAVSSVSAPGQMKFFSFQGVAGETATLKLDGLINEWIPSLELYGPAGRLAVSRLDIPLQATLRQNGQHTVVVRDEYLLGPQGVFGGTRTGGFALHWLSSASSCTVSSSAPLALDGVRPDRGGDLGEAEVTLYGAGFQPASSVRLRRAGQADVAGVVSALQENSTVLKAVLDLRNRARGKWDVTVSNPTGESRTLAEAFLIEAGEGYPSSTTSAAQLWARIDGPATVRRGSPATFRISYANRGRVSAYDSAILLELPRRVNATLRIAGTEEVFSYHPALFPADYQHDTAVVEVGLGALAGGATGEMWATLRVDDAQVPSFTLRAQAIEHQYVETGWDPEAGPGPGGVAASGRIRAYLLAAVSRCPGQNGCVATVRQRHPFFEVGGTWYTQVGGDGARNMTVVPSIEVAKANSLARKGRMEAGSGGQLCLVEDVKFEPGEFQRTLTPEQERALVQEFQMAVLHGPTQENCTQQPDTLFENAGIPDGLFSDEYYPTGRAGERTSAVAKALGIDPGVLPGALPIRPLYLLLHPECPSDPTAESSFPVTVVQAIDPNDKTGPRGAGAERFISASGVVNYSINFENLAAATAPAQSVEIRDSLDTARFDTSKVVLGPMRFGATELFPASSQLPFSQMVDLRPSRNLLVRVEAQVVAAGSELRWKFTSLDPATLQPPTDPLAGFLPPNRLPPEGEGSVSFTIPLKAGLASGTVVRNQASIVFDNNAAIQTRTWQNTVDGTPPASQVQALAETQSSATFDVRWTGRDDGSGVRDYTIWVSEDGAAFREWIRNTTALNATYGGQPGKRYAFFSVARDQAGNMEAPPAFSDAATRVASGLVQLAVANSASYAPAPVPVSPGSLVSLFGSGLDPTASLFALPQVPPGTDPVRLPTSLSGITVRFGGIPAALFYVGVGAAAGFQPGTFQINCQVPLDVALGGVVVEVAYEGRVFAATAALVGAGGPGIFTLLQSGSGQAAALNQDWSLNGDSAHPVIPGTTPRPALPGEVIFLFATGAGGSFKDFTTGQALRPVTGEGAPCSGRPLYATAATPAVAIGGAPAEVVFSGLAPCFVGLWQINVRVPANTKPGAELPVTVTLAGEKSNVATIAVR